MGDDREYDKEEKYYVKYFVRVKYVSGSTELLLFVEHRITNPLDNKYDREPELFDQDLGFNKIRDFDPSNYVYGKGFSDETVRKINTANIQEYEVEERQTFQISYNYSYTTEESNRVTSIEDRQLESEVQVEKLEEWSNPKSLRIMV